MTRWTDAVMHAQLNAQGLATMGACPDWDRAVTDFVASDVLARAHEEFGPLALAFHERRDSEDEYNRQMNERFYGRRFSIMRQLAATPAPTLAAAMFKAVIIEIHEVWNDPTLDADCIALIEADLARLASNDGATL